LYPLPPAATFKKNNHASGWHINLKKDVRSLKSVELSTEWFETCHHELGHVYYYIITPTIVYHLYYNRVPTGLCTKPWKV